MVWDLWGNLLLHILWRSCGDLRRRFYVAVYRIGRSKVLSAARFDLLEWPSASTELCYYLVTLCFLVGCHKHDELQSFHGWLLLCCHLTDACFISIVTDSPTALLCCPLCFCQQPSQSLLIHFGFKHVSPRDWYNEDLAMRFPKNEPGIPSRLFEVDADDAFKCKVTRQNTAFWMII